MNLVGPKPNMAITHPLFHSHAEVPFSYNSLTRRKNNFDRRKKKVNDG